MKLQIPTLLQPTPIDPVARVERDTAFLDYLRHIATLATGAVVVLAAFVGDFSEDAAGQISVWSSAIYLLLTSLFFNLVAYGLSLFCFFGRQTPRNAVLGWLFGLLFCISAFSMFAGLAQLGSGAMQVLRARAAKPTSKNVASFDEAGQQNHHTSAIQSNATRHDR